MLMVLGFLAAFGSAQAGGAVEDAAACGNLATRTALLEQLAEQRYGHAGLYEDAVALSLADSGPRMDRLSALIDARGDALQAMLPGYSLFTDEYTDVETVERAADNAIGGIWQRIQASADPITAKGLATVALYPRGEAGEEGRSVFGDVSEQAKNSAVLVYEGQYEMKPAINRYRPLYMDRLADWSAGALPPVEAFGPATWLFELNAPCATDQAALLEARLYRRSGDKVTEFNRVQYAAISRTATSTVDRVLWPVLLLAALVGMWLPVPRKPASGKARHKAVVVVIALAVGFVGAAAGLEAVQSILPTSHEDIDTPIEYPLLLAPVVPLLLLLIGPALVFAAVGTRFMALLPKLSDLSVERWTPYANLPAMPLAACGAGLWMMHRIAMRSLELDPDPLAGWALIPILGLLAMVPIAVAVEHTLHPGSVDSRRQSPAAIGVAAGIAALLLLGAPVAVLIGEASVLLGLCVVAAPLFVVAVAPLIGRTVGDESRQDAADERGDGDFIDGLPHRLVEALGEYVGNGSRPLESVQLVRLTGPDGAGKSRLARETMERFRDSHAGYWIDAQATEGDELGAVAQLLDTVIGGEAGAGSTQIDKFKRIQALKKDIGEQAEGYLRLIPAVAPVLGVFDGLQDSDAEASSEVLPGEVSQALMLLMVKKAVDGKKPWVIAIDNAHLLDPQSAEFFQKLKDEWSELLEEPAPRLDVILLCPADRSALPDDTIDGVHRIERIQHEKTIAVIAEARGWGIDNQGGETVERAMIRDTDGRLDFVLAWLDHLEESLTPGQSRTLTVALLREAALPPRMRDWLESVWANYDLTDEERWMVECAAQLGRRFHVADLAALLRREPLDVTRDLRRIQHHDDPNKDRHGQQSSRHVLRDLVAEDGTFEFVNPALQRARSMALTGGATDKQFAQMDREFARHVEGILWNRVAMLQPSLDAQVLPEVADLLAAREDLNRLKAVSEISPPAEDNPDQRRREAWVFACASRAALGSHRFHAVKPLALHALGWTASWRADDRPDSASTEEKKSPELKWDPPSGLVALSTQAVRDRVYTDLVRVLLLLDDEDFCSAVVQRWRDEHEAGPGPSDSQALARVLVRGSEALGRNRRHGDASEWAKEAARNADEGTLLHSEALFLEIWARNPRVSDEKKQAYVDDLRVVIDCLRKDPTRAARALLSRALDLKGTLSVRLPDQIEAYDASIEIKKELNDVEGLGYSYGGIARAYFYKASSKEDLANARRYFEDDIKVADAAGDVANMSSVRSQLADVVWRLGEGDYAEELLKRSLEIAKHTGNHENQVFPLIGEAKHRFREGDQSRAAACLSQALDVFEDWNTKQDPDQRISAASWADVEGASPWLKAPCSNAYKGLRSALEPRWSERSAVLFDWPDSPDWSAEHRPTIDALRVRFDGGEE